jgi:hypothetical protein
VATAWRNGVLAGFLLFFLALAATVPYFDPTLGEGGIAVVTDLSTALFVLATLELGRRTTLESGLWSAAPVAGAVAGFLSALSGLPAHAVLSRSASYAAYLARTVGPDARLAERGGMAVVLAGLFGAIVLTALSGGIVAGVGGVIGLWARRRRPAAAGGDA